MKLILSCIFVSSFLLAFSQKDSQLCDLPSKKVQKILKKASLLSDEAEKIRFYMDAIDLAPLNPFPYYDYGVYTYFVGNAMMESKGPTLAAEKALDKSKDMFEKAHGICKMFHSDCAYFLGVIYYNQGEKKKALSYFKEFKAFDDKDVAKYAADYSVKLSEVNKIIDELEGELLLIDNPVPFDPSIVPNISSPKDEYFPMISPDNELVFFTRKLISDVMGQKITKEDYFFAHRPDVKTSFDSGKPFSKPFNDGSFDSYGSATMSVDNKEMILCACKDIMVRNQKYRNCDLYVTRFERSGSGGNDFTWTPLENLGPGINSVDGWEAQPSLSPDGSMLIYTMYGPHTKNNDLYVSYRDADGRWLPANPIKELNTDGKDKSPFLHQDNETIYFVSSCSNERKGVGGTDIFYSRKENGKWGKPKNVGFPINTVGDEIGLFVSTDGKTAYYSSKGATDWNIFSFNLYREARPHAVALIKGELKDKNGIPISDASIELNYKQSGKKETVKVHGHDGKYTAVVRVEDPEDIVVTIKKEGYTFDSKLVSKEKIQEVRNLIKQIDKEEVQLSEAAKNALAISDAKTETTDTFSSPVIKDLNAINENNLMDGKPAESIEIDQVNLTSSELKIGDTYTLNDILFEIGKAVLTQQSKAVIAQFSLFLKEKNAIEIIIQGHTDNAGDATRNLSLSQERAGAVRDELLLLGIASGRLQAIGYGDTLPKVPNDNEDNRTLNRRTDFLIKKLN